METILAWSGCATSANITSTIPAWVAMTTAQTIQHAMCIHMYPSAEGGGGGGGGGAASTIILQVNSKAIS